MKPKPCLHRFVNADDPDLTKPHPGTWRWICVYCGKELN